MAKKYYTYILIKNNKDIMEKLAQCAKIEFIENQTVGSSFYELEVLNQELFNKLFTVHAVNAYPHMWDELEEK